MVAISLYRGNLHRASDVPRRWPMPPRALTLEQFRMLTRRRDQSLSRLAAQRNPNSVEKKEEAGEVKDCSVSDPQPTKVEDEPRVAEVCEMIDANLNEFSNGKALDVDALKGSEKEMVDAKNEMIDANANEKNSNDDDDDDDDAIKGSEMGMNDTKIEVSNADKEKRKIELEKKLEVLNQKKHHLVQMLKQILNAEEEINRRNSQPAAIRASLPPQIETAVDMGSATRHVPKVSVEVNFNGDIGAESDPTASHSAHGRQMHYMHSASPSATSLTRPFQQNAILPMTKSSLATPGAATAAAAGTASPSHFAAPASSPSPAASGGASSLFFRDSSH